MAPPTLKPRLNVLTPDGVAMSAALAAFQHTQDLVQTLLAPAYAGVHLQGREQAEELCRQTTVYQAVRCIAAYAIAGTEDLADVASAWKLLLPLWSSAIGQAVAESELRSGIGELDSPLGVVLCAAAARQLLAHNRPLSAVQLGVLGGLSATQVRLLSRNGELSLVDGKISAPEARRWLARRCVPGIA